MHTFKLESVMKACKITKKGIEDIRNEIAALQVGDDDMSGDEPVGDK
jgi:hypothetical protein